MEHTDTTRLVVAVVNDLMFGSKIRAAGAQTGVQVVFARSADALRQHAAQAQLVLIDLDTRLADPASLIHELKHDAATSAVPVVAFGSHVETEVLTAARKAGADRVMARSAFVRVLPTLLLGTE